MSVSRYPYFEPVRAWGDRWLRHFGCLCYCFPPALSPDLASLMRPADEQVRYKYKQQRDDERIEGLDNAVPEYAIEPLTYRAEFALILRRLPSGKTIEIR